MVKYKVVSALSWTGTGGVVISVYKGILPELVAVPIVSFLIALGFLSTGLVTGAKAKEEEREEREETFIGY